MGVTSGGKPWQLQPGHQVDIYTVFQREALFFNKIFEAELVFFFEVLFLEFFLQNQKRAGLIISYLSFGLLPRNRTRMEMFVYTLREQRIKNSSL